MRHKEDKTSVLTPLDITGTSGIQKHRLHARPVAWVHFSLGWFNLVANSEGSPATPRGNYNPRCSNMIRITVFLGPKIPGAWSHKDYKIPEAT